jgi:pyruvate, water dikinase
MKKDKKNVLWFREIGIDDVGVVGGKNAALGEMHKHLAPKGVPIPDGFAITAHAFRYFLKHEGLDKKIHAILRDLKSGDIKDLQKRAKEVRGLVLGASLPQDLAELILENYKAMGKMYGKENVDVAVRSSATAEDLPGASFAGQQETYLDIVGGEHLLTAVRKCMASLFTDRAISYRHDKGFSEKNIALSVGIQKMVRSDLASSGVIFTIDTETGFNKVVVVTGSWGLGEMIVQGKVKPDEFVVFKPTFEAGRDAIISKVIGEKGVKLVYSANGTRTLETTKEERETFCITNREAMTLAKWAIEIEKYFSKKHGHYQPMDIEWAKDGRTGKLFIVQARPETVHAGEEKARVHVEYRLGGAKGRTILEGVAVGMKIASGKVHVIKSPKQITEFKKGEILVTEITDPDWEPIMKMAGAIITDKGGRTSHAAIVSRELGIPCIVGSVSATRLLKNGRMITVDSSSGTKGLIYEGAVPFKILEHHIDKLPKTRTHVMVNIGSPDEAFKYSTLPVQGVGLGRLEFIIASQIKAHPKALLEYSKLKAKAKRSPEFAKIVSGIDALTVGYRSKTGFYVDTLAYGIAKIAAAFYPHEVIIRFSDFKTNEYRTLLGGALYEPLEENPMLGWRGASRYYDPKFTAAFALECRAVRRVREEMGLMNVVPMVPFCRTPREAEEVMAQMKKAGLVRGRQGLKVYVMCEIPSNVLLAEEFLKFFDGMSIGSNDLTQLTLGLDRDSGIVSHVANENNPAVKSLIAQVIKICRLKKKYVGICGQAPSDFPDFARFLVDCGIESISLNPDTVVSTLLQIAKQEKRNTIKR